MSTRDAQETIRFLKQFLAAPRLVGAVAASSTNLADLVTEVADLRNASVAVEFGPGTGALTEKILQKLPESATFLAMEINPDFVTALRLRFPGVQVFQDSAANTRKYLAQVGAEAADVVVSGLPWTSFGGELQDTLLNALLDVLKPGGRFVTYAYLTGLVLPAARKFRRKLHTRFRRVSTTRIIWKNIPPAFVYYAEKPAVASLSSNEL